MKPFSIVVVIISLISLGGVLTEQTYGQQTWNPPKLKPPKFNLFKLENPFKKKQYVEPIELTDQQRKPLFTNPLNGNRPLISDRTKNWFKEFDNRSRAFWQNAGQNLSAFHKANTQRLRETTNGLFKPFDFTPKTTPKEFIERTKDSMNFRREKQIPRMSEMPKVQRGDSTQPKIRY